MVRQPSNSDLAAFLAAAQIGGTGEAIQHVERQGQLDFVLDDDFMPVNGDWNALEAFGFASPEPTDDALFARTALPAGWTKAAEEHEMGSVVLDERGVPRVSVFYKAAFYDRQASFTVLDVAEHLATKVVYGTGAAGLPDLWPVLTEAERAGFEARMREYQGVMAANPAQWTARQPRVDQIIAAIEAAQPT